MDIIYNEENASKRKVEYDEKFKHKYEKSLKEKEKAKKIFSALLPIITVGAIVTGVCDIFAMISHKTTIAVILFILMALLGIGAVMVGLMKFDTNDAIEDIKYLYDKKENQYKYPIDVQLYDLFKEYKLLSVKTGEKSGNYMCCHFMFEDLVTGAVKESSRWFDVQLSTKYDKETLDVENHTLYLPYKKQETDDFEIRKEM